VKCIKFVGHKNRNENNKLRQIKDAIKEYFLLKIASILEVGPSSVGEYNCFDLIIYQDCMEFMMEKCRKINNET
jgi:hypothetical protein